MFYSLNAAGYVKIHVTKFAKHTPRKLGDTIFIDFHWPFFKKNRYGHEHNLFVTNEENSRRGQGAAKRKGKKKAPARQRVHDGLAKHAKDRLTRLRCEDEERIENHQIIVNALNQIKNRTAYSLPRSVGKQVSVDTLDGITGYHQYCFPSPLGLEVAAARFSSFDEGLAFKATKMDYSWNLQDEDWEKISAMVIGEN